MQNRAGYRFYPRCPKRMDVCAKAFPPMLQTEDDYKVACYLYQ